MYLLMFSLSMGIIIIMFFVIIYVILVFITRPNIEKCKKDLFESEMKSCSNYKRPSENNPTKEELEIYRKPYEREN